MTYGSKFAEICTLISKSFPELTAWVEGGGATVPFIAVQSPTDVFSFGHDDKHWYGQNDRTEEPIDLGLTPSAVPKLVASFVGAKVRERSGQ